MQEVPVPFELPTEKLVDGAHVIHASAFGILHTLSPDEIQVISSAFFKLYATHVKGGTWAGHVLLIYGYLWTPAETVHLFLTNPPYAPTGLWNLGTVSPDANGYFFNAAWIPWPEGGVPIVGHSESGYPIYDNQYLKPSNVRALQDGLSREDGPFWVFGP